MTRMKRGHVLVGIAGCALALGGADAQTSGAASALKGHNGNAPIDISADRIEVQDRADRAMFIGNVHAVQQDLVLDTARLTVAYTSGGKGAAAGATPGGAATGGGNIQIQRLDAAGGVTVRSPSETARGDFGIYDLDRKLITLIGAVQLDREANHVSGQRLVLDLTSGRAVMDGGGAGGGGGRVVGHFTVPQRSGQ